MRILSLLKEYRNTNVMRLMISNKHIIIEMLADEAKFGKILLFFTQFLHFVDNYSFYFFHIAKLVKKDCINCQIFRLFKAL